MGGFHTVMVRLVGISLLCELFSFFRKEDVYSKSYAVEAGSCALE